MPHSLGGIHPLSLLEGIHPLSLLGGIHPLSLSFAEVWCGGVCVVGVTALDPQKNVRMNDCLELGA